MLSSGGIPVHIMVLSNEFGVKFHISFLSIFCKSKIYISVGGKSIFFVVEDNYNYG